MTQTYTTPGAMWRAAVDRARAIARVTGRRSAAVLREFLYARVFDRVFADPGALWVLKGGTALLVRVEDARHSRDVDLLHQDATLMEAVAQLRAALALDRGDHLQLQVTTTSTVGGGQQDVAGLRVGIQAYAGPKKVDSFHIDLVVGSLMTADPEERAAPSEIDILGLPVPTVRLYPIVDHVADKLCATESTYPGGHPSSRARDLVDLVVIARTETMTLRALHAAIASERHHRGLPPRDSFIPPPSWERLYREPARGTPHCADLDFLAAVSLVSTFLNPALVTPAREEDRTWEPGTQTWASLVSRAVGA